MYAPDPEADAEARASPPFPFPETLLPLLRRSGTIAPKRDPEHALRNPDCCLALSGKLRELLTDHFLPGTGLETYSDTASEIRSLPLILSVGSGSGLLERLLQLSRAPHPSSPTGPDDNSEPVDVSPGLGQGVGPARVRVVGVEVSDSVNKYLPPQDTIAVRGTWEVAAEVDRAAALMFVYPRQARLVERYLERFGAGPVRAGSGEGEESGEVEAGEKVGTVVWLGPVVDWEDGGFGAVLRKWADTVGGHLEEWRGSDMGLPEEEMGVVVKRKSKNPI